jgi:hypothetical protein
MTYLTKAENLKVRLDKTRKGDVVRRELGLKGYIVRLGGIGWYSSILVQIIWHSLGVLSNLPASETPSELQPLSIQSCVRQASRLANIEKGCYDEISCYAFLFPVVGMLSFWWNNRLRESLQGFGRLSHLNDYYLLQAIFLAIRYAAVRLFTHSTRFSPLLPPVPAHTFMIIFSLAVSLSTQFSSSDLVVHILVIGYCWITKTCSSFGLQAQARYRSTARIGPSYFRRAFESGSFISIQVIPGPL